MSPADRSLATRGKHRRGRRLRRAALWALGLLTLLLAAHPLWLPLALERLAPPLVLRLAGLRLELEVERASLRRLEVRRLGLRPAEGDQPLEWLSLEEGRVDLAPGALLGLDWMGLVRRARLRGLVLHLDLGVPPVARPERRPGAETPFQLPADLPTIELTDGSLRLGLADGSLVSTRSLALSLRADGEGRVACRDLTWVTAAGTSAAERAELRFAWQPRRVALRSLMVAEREWIGPSWLDLSRAGHGELRAEFELLALGGRAELGLELAPGVLAARLSALDLAPGRVPVWLLPAELGPLGGALDLEGQVRVDLGEPGRSSGRAVLAGRGLEGAGVRIDRLEAQLELADGFLTGQGLEAVRGPNRLRASEFGIPLDAPGPLEVLRRARADLELVLPDPEALLARLDLALPDELRGRLELAAELSSGVLAVRRAHLEAPGVRARIGAGRVDLSDPSHPEVDLDLSLAVDDLGHTLAQLPDLGAEGRLGGILLLRGRWPELSGELDLHGSDLVLARARLGTVDLAADLRRGRVGLRRALARSPAARLELQGSLELPPGGGFDPRGLRLGPSRLSLVARDLVALHPDLPPGRVDLELAAHGSLELPSYELDLELSLAPPDEAAGSGPAARALRELSLTARGDQERLEVEALRLRGEHGDLSAAGTAELAGLAWPRALDLTRLELAQGSQDLRLVAPARVELGPGDLSIDGLVLEGSLGRLEAHGRLVGQEGAFEVEARGLTLDPLLTPWLALWGGPDAILGVLDGALEIAWAAGELGLAGDGLVSGARVAGGPPLDLDWRVGLAGGQGELAALLSWPDGALRAEGRGPFAPLSGEPLGPGELRGSFHLAGGLGGLASLLGPRGLELDGVLEGSLELAGPWDAVALHLRLEGDLVTLRGLGFDLLAQPARLQLDLSAGGEASEDVLRLDAPERFELEARGELGPALDLASLARGEAGSLWSRALAGHLEARLEDLGELVRALESQGLERQLLREGGLELWAELGGTLGAPTYGGRAELTDARVRLGQSLPPLRNLGGSLRLTPDAVELEGLRGELGGAPFVVRGRAARPEPGSSYHLDLTLTGEDLLLHRERGIQVRTDADLRVRGAVGAGLEIGGKLTLSDGRYARNFDPLSFGRDRRPAGARGFELFSLREPPLSNLRFDVEVDSRSAFRIDNNALRGGLRPALRLQGSGEVPVLLGTIFLDPIRVNLPSGAMRLGSGVVRFEPADPFVPQLSIQGGMRLRGFDIQITIQGPYDAPEILLSSSPPLSDRALLVLVLTGELPPEEEGSLVAASAGRSLAIFLARDFLTRWFDDESVDDDESLLDRFEIATGRDVTRTGSETVEASFRMAERVFRPNDALFLRGERDVYDEFNYGVRLLFRVR